MHSGQPIAQTVERQKPGQKRLPDTLGEIMSMKEK